jgi:aldose 1-epimerase
VVTVKEFGKTTEGKVVNLYCISNSKGFEADVINYGAILTNLFVTDKDGVTRDVVLGFDKLEDYYGNGSFFGATVGPNANRIKDAKFELNGKMYHLDANDNANNLHSHAQKGLHKVYWNAEIWASGDAVTFTTAMKDGELGFPGNRTFHVTYTVTEDNELKITYNADSDAETIINMTNHSYFNLSGHDAGRIEDTRIKIKATRYTEILSGAIPTGNLPSVKETPMDLTEFIAVGAHVDDDFEQLVMVQGYDHNYPIDKETDGIEKIAEIIDDKSGIGMEVYTDLPGVQFYAGNCIGEERGKNGVNYGKRSGLCLETQYFPNAINEPNFEKPVFGPDKPYNTTTIYKFYTE